MARLTDTPETRAALRLEIRILRDNLARLAESLATVDHDAARDANEARSSLFAAWSKLRQAPPTDAVCPLIRQAMKGAE